MKNTIYFLLMFISLLITTIPAESQLLLFSYRKLQLQKDQTNQSINDKLEALNDQSEKVQKAEDEAAKRGAPRYVADDIDNISSVQDSSRTLKNYYDNKEYKKAISCASQFENNLDAATLVILGDCYIKEAEKEDQELQIMALKTAETQTQLISQGIYVDNTPFLLLSQSLQDGILKLKFKAIDCFEKASKLGNSLGSQRLTMLNAMYGGKSINTYSLSSNQNSSTFQPSTSKCSFCNGTGKVAGTVATYGNNKSYWCDFCKKEVPASHCCQCAICPSCGGKGYR